MGKQKNLRGKRLGEEMRRIISDLLARDMKDPAFDGMISITHVQSTDDGSFATVYFTCLEGNEDAVTEGFIKAQGFIRNEIGRKLGIRRSPELRFRPDDTEISGRRIDSILDELDISGPEGRVVNLDELPEIIDKYESYIIFTHVHLDGDTLGSSVAFAESMRETGREAWVVIGEEVPRTLEMLKMPYIVDADEAENILTEKPYLAVMMDFPDSDRLEGREELFFGAEETVSIDHHAVSNQGCDYNYADTEAAATSEIVFRLLKEANLPLTERVATALYIGIVTDTGRFQYANTTPETHRIAAELLESGADFHAAYRNIYQNVKAEKLFVQSEMLKTLDIFAGGKAALAYISADFLKRLDAGEDETDGMSEVLRSIIGVEVSAFLRETPDGRVKVSMRSKGNLDVAALSAKFGGGGHTRAAGFTTDKSIAEIKDTLKDTIKGSLSEMPAQ